MDESEAGFNLTVFYGKDADWASVVNACRRYPMFAERQVVLLKEAQQMKDIEKLEGYFESPLASTIFVIAYKGKTFDKRTKLYKVLKQHAEIFSSEKVKDYKLQEWIGEFVKGKGYKINAKAISLLDEHIGNDLNRIANEIEKLALNLKALLDALIKAKPATSKGQYVKRVALSSTMGPGVRVDASTL